MGVHLLHGEIGAAWAANPFVFLLLAGLVAAAGAWTVELRGGPSVRLPGRLADQRVWYIALAIAALAFTIARNVAG